MKCITDEMLLEKLEQLHATPHHDRLDIKDAVHAVQLCGLCPSLKDIELLQSQKPFEEPLTLKQLRLWATHLCKTQPSTKEIREKLMWLCHRFDAEGNGFIRYEALKSLLLNVGERLTEDQVNSFFSTHPLVGSSNLIHYESFIERLLVGLSSQTS